MYTDFSIETERLLLRNYVPDDVDDFYDILRREEVTRNVNLQPQTREQVETALDKLIALYKQNTPEQLVRFSVAVVDRAANKQIGWAGLAPLELDDSQVELYYGFHPDSWGRGLATEAAAVMLDFGFRQVKLPRVCGITLKENRASARVLEKIGLVYRCSICDLPEKFQSFERCTYYSLSREDYLAMNSLPTESQ